MKMYCPTGKNNTTVDINSGLNKNHIIISMKATFLFITLLYHGQEQQLVANNVIRLVHNGTVYILSYYSSCK